MIRVLVDHLEGQARQAPVGRQVPGRETLCPSKILDVGRHRGEIEIGRIDPA